MAKLALISEATVRDIVTRQLAYGAVQKAFEAVALQRSAVFDVVVGDGLQAGEQFAIKSGNDGENRLVGFKFGSYWAGNVDRGLPSHGSTIVLLDPDTGFPQGLVSANYLNGFRTAAADAIAVSCLARPDARVLGVLGAGHQAEQEIRAVAEVRDLERIKVYTRSSSRADWLANQLADFETEVLFCDAEQAVRDSDIVVTVTPSREPIVENDWIKPGTHISAMGADTRGKQELETAILPRARLYAEYPAQSVAIGEFQHGLDQGLIASADEVCALGNVTLGNAPGRESPEDITVFDSSGIAAQDLAVGRAVFEAAAALNRIEYVDF